MQRSYNMLKELSKSCSITLISLGTYSKITNFYQNFDEGVSQVKNSLSEICQDVVIVPHGKYSRRKNKIINGFKSLFRPEPYDVAILENKEFFLAVKKAVSEKEYDLIHIDTVGLWQYINGIDLPTILNHHNVESQMLFRRAKNSKFPLNIYFSNQAVKLRKIENKACHTVSANVTCSQLDSDRLSQIGVKTAHVIPNGVDTDYFFRQRNYPCPKLSEECKLLFVGGLEWYPNAQAVSYLLEHVWPKLNKQVADISLSVVGRGKHDKLEKYASENKRIFAPGFVDDVRPIMEEASIYVCPIKDGGGTKLKILDALAMGIPIVADPIACEGIDVVNGEHVLFASTGEEYIEAIKTLNNNVELRKKISQNAQRLIAEKYSYKKVGENIREIYEKVPSGHEVY